MVTETLDLIDILVTRQDAAGMTDAEFAARIGISREMWRRVRQRTARIGNKTRSRILRAFPELREHILGFDLPA